MAKSSSATLRGLLLLLSILILRLMLLTGILLEILIVIFRLMFLAGILLGSSSSSSPETSLSSLGSSRYSFESSISIILHRIRVNNVSSLAITLAGCQESIQFGITSGTIDKISVEFFTGDEFTFFIGLSSKQDRSGIFISQDKYVVEILKKFDFVSVKTANTPIETQKPLVKDEEASDVDVHLYRSMIGSLMYLTASRPDIMFAICACSRFQVTPKTSHVSAVKRIFRHLKGKSKLGLWYPRVSLFDLEAYSDSDYAGVNLDRKSTTGGCRFLGKRLISWQCKKQTIVATSTIEAKYVAAANYYGQVLWIQNQMLDHRFNFINTKIYIDNESTICLVKNPVYHSKTKHIVIRHHFIRDAYEKKLIQVLKIHTDDNVADLLTKAFDFSMFCSWVVTIGHDQSISCLVIGERVIDLLYSLYEVFCVAKNLYHSDDSRCYLSFGVSLEEPLYWTEAPCCQKLFMSLVGKC
ncbi:hypothetical protein Tco_0289608 [Tanacetum coccineum]